jgi:hypothetical protein
MLPVWYFLAGRRRVLRRLGYILLLERYERGKVC